MEYQIAVIRSVNATCQFSVLNSKIMLQLITRGVNQIFHHNTFWLSSDTIFADTLKHIAIWLQFDKIQGPAINILILPVTFLLTHKCNQNVTWTFNWT